MIPTSTSLSLVLWLSYSGAPSATSAELTLVLDLPSEICQRVLSEMSEPEILGTLGSLYPSKEEPALGWVLYKKTRHPKMIWGFRCVAMPRT